MSDVLVVLTTFGDEVGAKKVARDLVERRLVACVNLLPGATSIYCWEGKVCEEGEVVAVMKMTRGSYPELEKVLAEKHPYTNELIDLVEWPRLSWSNSRRKEGEKKAQCG